MSPEIVFIDEHTHSRHQSTPQLLDLLVEPCLLQTLDDSKKVYKEPSGGAKSPGLATVTVVRSGVYAPFPFGSGHE